MLLNLCLLKTIKPAEELIEAKFVKKDEKGFVYPLNITKRIEDDFKTFITPEWQEELFNLE